MALKPLVICGTSGHARVVAEAVRRAGQYNIVGFLDDANLDRHGSTFCGAEVLGARDRLPFLFREGVRHAFVAFGHNRHRLTLGEHCASLGFELPVLVHPSAVVAADAVIEPGAFVAAGAIVGPASSVGAHSIINTGAIVEHDCVVAKGVHLSPRACLAGAVRVGECSWIGAGAVVRDKLVVGREAVVGMGAVVTRPVPDGVMVYGCPARIQGKTDS